MKQLLIAAMFLMISVASFGQTGQTIPRQLYLSNTPTYSTGGYTIMVHNSTTNRLESVVAGTVSATNFAKIDSNTFGGATTKNYVDSSTATLKRKSDSTGNTGYMTHYNFGLALDSIWTSSDTDIIATQYFVQNRFYTNTYTGTGNGTKDTFHVTVPTGYYSAFVNLDSGQVAGTDSVCTYGAHLSGTTLTITFYDIPGRTIPPRGTFKMTYTLFKKP
jgi:hypothetical protein